MVKTIKDPPGRPRKFERDTALEQATAVFWEHGFAQTTYGALEQATGLHRQSLVYAFGDKKALFQAVLQHYAATRVQVIIDQLQAPGSPMANIRAVYARWLEDARREATTGCLFVNTAGELGSADPAFSQVIEQSTQRLDQAFQQAIRAGQRQGEIIADLAVADLAKQAIAVGDGGLLRSRASGNPTFAEEVFQSFLALIER
ncbi:MAG: TetR/AcrR family transcriptional regulator [Nodosilinea sp.]